jgi:hypothetical protein
VRLEELDAVCREAARDLLARRGRPVPTSVVLPLPAATKLTTLEGFPDDDAARAALLARFADDVMRPAKAPCYGFVAEAVADDADVLVVVYGAHRQGARVTAAPLDGDALGDFGPAEDLDAAALPFLAPLQAAADAAIAVVNGAGPGR